MKESNTTSTATSSTHTATSCNFIPPCKYRLPCGICDRTGNHCTEFFNYPYYRSYPCYPFWNEVTCAQGTSINADYIKTGTTTANTKIN